MDDEEPDHVQNITPQPPLDGEPTKVPTMDAPFRPEVTGSAGAAVAGSLEINPDDGEVTQTEESLGEVAERALDSTFQTDLSATTGPNPPAPEEKRAVSERAIRVAEADLSTPDADSFVEDIDSGTIPSQEVLEARIGAAPDVISGKRFVKNSQGRLINANGEEEFDERKRAVETREVSETQAEALVVVAREREETREVAKQAEKELRSVADTASYCQDILDGTIPSQEVLEARIGAAPDVISGKRFVKNSQGRLINANGEEEFDERKRAVETREVSETQAEALVVVAREREETKEIAKQAEKELRSVADTASYCQDILDGTIPSQEVLEARIGAAPDVISGKRFVKNSQGRLINANGEEEFDERKRAVETREVSETQGRILVALQAEIADSKEALPEEIKSQVQGPLTLEGVDAQIKAVQEKRQAAQMATDIEVCDQTLADLQRLRGAVDRCQVIIGFNQALNNGEPTPEQATAFLQNNNTEDVQELELVATLARSTGQKVVKSLVDDVLKPDVDPSAAIERILGVSSSLDDRGRESAVKLLRITGRLELVKSYIDVFSGATVEQPGYKERIERLRALPLRPDIGGAQLFEERAKLFEAGKDTLVLARAAEIRGRFADDTVGASELIRQISELPLEEPEDMLLQEGLYEALEVYIAARRDERPEDFRSIFIDETLAVEQIKSPEFPKSLELGRNLEAFKYLSKGFKEAILPLFQSLKADDRTKDIERFIRSGRMGSLGREAFVISTDRLSEQRSLTEIEEEYLRSVELLSAFNPHLVGIMKEAPEVARVFLQNHFSELSRTTTEALRDGSYTPVIVIGTGPNGLTALGELVRTMPGVAGEILLVDQASLPGGPFSVPGGPAWELNSANERGVLEPTLPDSPDQIDGRRERVKVEEEQTVRAYGSPLSWYPGERGGEADVRLGSINTSVDYLPTPDDASELRYPTNDDESLVLQLQTALLSQRLALNTTVMDVRPAPEDGLPGTKEVTLGIVDPASGESRIVHIRTDAVVVASGLGEPGYGFELNGSKAERVLERNRSLEPTQFPLLTDTLGAFSALASREVGQAKVLGETLVIWGDGNSTDTILEYVGKIFSEGENPSVGRLKKVIVVSTGEPSRRPRYARINDLRPRNGQGNLVEFVDGRVSDVELVVQGGTKVRVLDSNGRPILDEDGEPIIADSAIAATGFRPGLDRVFGSYLEDGQSLRRGDAVEEVTLPTNQRVSVADQLKDDPSVIFVGTASRPGFDSQEKLAQLPPEARDALQRNGAENAVAIGFRAPDTRAAMRLFATERRAELRKSSEKGADRIEEKIQILGNIEPGTSLTINESDEARLPLRRQEIDADSPVLTPLLLHELGDIRTSDIQSGGLDFVINEGEGGTLNLTYEGDSSADPRATAQINKGVSGSVLERLSKALSNPYIRSYLKAPSTRRQASGFRIRLEFTRGKLDLRKTFILPV